jgi:polyhydroxyalkanoate synthesis repressor PhaR
MTTDKPPITIKKYANRRLYNTGTSAYVTLEDLAAMVKHGEDFVVYDAKTGEDITRSVLTQIIFEQEGKGGQALLPITFLRQLIRFYGSSMQMLVPSYLEYSLDHLASQQADFAERCGAAFSAPNAFAAARPMFAQIEEQSRNNIAMFRQALSLFASYPKTANGQDHAAAAAPADDEAPPTAAAPTQADLPGQQPREEFESMKRQLEDLQRRIEALAPKS